MPSDFAPKGSSCTPTDTAIRLFVNACQPIAATLDTAWLTGSLAFTLGSSATAPRTLAAVDSILISYAGSAAGWDTAELHLRYDLGSGVRDTMILLTGRSSAASNPQFLHRAAASAYYGQLDSLGMGIDISSSINLDSLWPFVTDIQATFAFDSSVVGFQSYSAPAGWLLSSLTSHGNSVDFSVHKTSGAATRPLEIGTALFSPNSQTLATSWVTLPRFVIEAGGQAISLCVSDNEDSHWSVKSLGEQSDVTKAPSPGSMPNADLVVYPNPARSDCFVYNPNVSTALVTLYDVTGRSVASTSVSGHSTSTLDMESLASGSYILIDQVAGRIATYQISKIR